METILVLTDFSYTAFNAARYAVNLANQLHAAKVILYHSFTSIPSDNPPPFASEVNDLWSQTHERLYELKSSLEFFTDRNTKIEIRTDQNSLQSAIENIKKEKKAELVVMGSTGNNKLNRLFIGSNAISLSDTCKLPLLIIPPDTEFEKIERSVFVCDLQNTAQIPVRSMKSFLHQLHSKLSVLYIHNETDALETSDIPKKALQQLAHSKKPQFSFIHGDDIVDEIINYSSTNHIQLIIAIHKKHRFLQNIFHPSATSQLAYYSHFPLLILKPRNSGENSLESYLNYKNHDLA